MKQYDKEFKTPTPTDHAQLCKRVSFNTIDYVHKVLNVKEYQKEDKSNYEKFIKISYIITILMIISTIDIKNID